MPSNTNDVTPVELPASANRPAPVRRLLAARDLAQIAIFAALIYALGLPGTLFIGGSAVPITLQTLGVMLAGAILGPWKGLAAVAVFDTLILVGLPVLAGGRGGVQFLTVAPSAGYAWGFLLGAFLVGLFTRLILPRYPLWLGIVLTAIGGMVGIYLIGVPWMAAVFANDPAKGMTFGPALWAAFTGNFLYFPGDVIKVVATAVIAKQVHRAYPGLIPKRTRRAAPAAVES